MFKLTFRVHALTRMSERNVSVKDIQAIITDGELIRSYPDDTPYPSRLLLGKQENRILHVVVADNVADEETIVITVYEPDPALWDEAFKRKKQS